MTAPFRVLTTQREWTLQAEDLEHARRIVTGTDWPVGVPPAPQPAQHPPEPGQAFGRPTEAWSAWYEAAKPRLGRRLAWEHGECLVRIEPLPGECCICRGPDGVLRDNGELWCRDCWDREGDQPILGEVS